MTEYMDLSGIWQCEIPGQGAPIRLPGTLDESGIGFPDDPEKQWKVDEARRIGFYQTGDPIVTRFTRKHSFEGKAKLSRVINLAVPKDKRIFLECQRARHLRLIINGEEILPYDPPSISTPWVFEVTGKLTGDDQIVLLSDNSYPSWPREAMVYASAASDETQTNWNGILGYFRLRIEEKNFISSLRIYRDDKDRKSLKVCVEIDAQNADNRLIISSPALAGMGQREIEERILPGKKEYWYQGLEMELRPDIKPWDAGEGNLYSFTASLSNGSGKSVSFGVRDFEARNGYLYLNDRRFFLRGEANCAVFPETGYIPMDKETWKKIIVRYQAYGINCLRFHSHCPPEGAFEAADEMGMLMQPELSHWDPEHAFHSPEAKAYYKNELLAILRHLANHPSFVMLTFGNELQADQNGHAYMDDLLSLARSYDPSRLYADGSNTHYGQLGANASSDFYAAMSYRGMEMRATCDGMTGFLNHEYPNACHHYGETMKAIREKTDQPVFSFEVGQYEVLPDFDEIEDFHGVLSPENYRHIQKKVIEKGLQSDWKKMVEATGESSLLCYRTEVESALRTEQYSGISLLGLQDFPGQGTALVGMMNTHLEPKPYSFAKPERFSAFFRDVLPLALLPRYTYVAGEKLTAQLKIANYGKKDIWDTPVWKVQGDGFHASGSLDTMNAPAGKLSELGEISLSFDAVCKAVKLTLTLSFGQAANEYPLWVYPDAALQCPENVYECRTLDDEAWRVLEQGGSVYLSPDSTKEALPHSIQAQFSPDFWSVCTFPHQEGGMGQWIDESHPLFHNFPTESFSNWQWWPMANQRAMILPSKIKAIVTEMDSYAFLRPMAKLFEGKCGNGKILVSSLGLHQLTQYPEARTLLQAVYRYVSSDAFAPDQTLSRDWLNQLFFK